MYFRPTAFIIPALFAALTACATDTDDTRAARDAYDSAQTPSASSASTAGGQTIPAPEYDGPKDTVPPPDETTATSTRTSDSTTGVESSSRTRTAESSAPSATSSANPGATTPTKTTSATTQSTGAATKPSSAKDSTRPAAASATSTSATSTRTASAAGPDPAKGKAIADEQCAECHEASEWEGETLENIAAMIKAVNTGAVKHKPKIKLTDEQIRAIAAHWSVGG